MEHGPLDPGLKARVAILSFASLSGSYNYSLLSWAQWNIAIHVKMRHELPRAELDQPTSYGCQPRDAAATSS